LQPPPTVLILNTGMWQALPSATYAIDLRERAQRAAPRVVWKTTTRMRQAGETKWQRTDLLARRIFDEVYDSAYLTRRLVDSDYWDARHFLPHVYNALNAALLRQLYGPPSRCHAFSHGACDEREPKRNKGARERRGGGAAPADATVGQPVSLGEASARMAAVATADPLPREEGWSGVGRRPPRQWSVVQALMWVDSLGVGYNPAAFTHEQLNGSSLLRIVESADFAQIGVKGAADRAKLRDGLSRL